MRRHAVAECMWRDRLVEPDGVGGSLDAALHTAAAHGSRRDGSRLAVATVGRKQQPHVAMLFPVVPQDLQGTFGQRQVSVFGSFATMDVNGHPLRINVTDLQIESFFQSQAKRVDAPQKSSIVQLPGGRNQLMDLSDRQHLGQRRLFGHFEFMEDIPVSWTGRGVKELQRTVGHFQRARSKLTSLIRCNR